MVHKIPKNIDENGEKRRKFLRMVFDENGYIRVRIRRFGRKKKKVRNLRIVSKDMEFVKNIKDLLELEGISSLIYTIGEKYFCLDIEGKQKLETFLKKIGFLNEKKKKQLVEAIKPLSLSKGEDDK